MSALILKGLFLIGIVIVVLAINYRHRNLAKVKSDDLTLSIEKYEGEPEYFGYKSMWIAVKSIDNKSVAEFIKQIEDSTSVKLIFKHPTWDISISSVKSGWVFIIGSIPGDSEEGIDKLKKLLVKLSEKFGEAQFFGTHRVVEFNSWARAISGHLIRIYSYLGESGENYCVEGEPTGVEKKYKLINSLSEESKKEGYYDQTDLTIPDESIVMEIAGDWSMDPTKFTDEEWKQLWTNALVLKYKK